MKTLIAVLLLGAFLHVDCAISESEQTTILSKHNEWRAAIGATNMYKLEWDSELASLAQGWASQCNITHNPNRNSGTSYNPVGENCAWNTNSDLGNMMTGWFDENQYYTYSSNSCSNGDYGCLHYTQIVWAKTKKIGCGSASCTIYGYDATWFVCNYATAGNWNGESPYDTNGNACSACDSGDSCESGADLCLD